MFVVDARSRPTSSGLRTTGRRRGSRIDTTSSARSLRFSVTLKKNRRAVALTLTVGTVGAGARRRHCAHRRGRPVHGPAPRGRGNRRPPRRLAVPLAPRHKAGLLAKYAAQVGQANKGAVTHAGGADWPWFDR